MITPLMIEQHFHGCFGIDFNKADAEDILYLSKEIVKYGVGGIFPTIVTDSVENTRKAIANIKRAASVQTSDMAKILGIHLEGIFINKEKKGIHNPEHILPLTPDNYKLIEDDFIKIITLAPELDEGLMNYLMDKNVKIQAGHCVGGELNGCDGVTHTYNAMSGVSHRGTSTALSALTDDNLYTEIIADGLHVSDAALKLLFKVKPAEKVILVSDCLHCTKSAIKEFIFAYEKIFFDGNMASSAGGTLAGSTCLLSDIIKRLHNIGMFNPQFINNPYVYHNLDPWGHIDWAEDFNILNVEIK
jgi:N-acetylglucosamine-6-phosphate deacetylase